LHQWQNKYYSLCRLSQKMTAKIFSSFVPVVENHHRDNYDRIVNYTAFFERSSSEQQMVPGYLREVLVCRQRPTNNVMSNDMYSIVFDFLREQRPSDVELKEEEQLYAKRMRNAGVWFPKPTKNSKLEEWETWIKKQRDFEFALWVLDGCELCLFTDIVLLVTSIVSIIIECAFCTSLSIWALLLYAIVLLACSKFFLCLGAIKHDGIDLHPDWKYLATVLCVIGFMSWSMVRIRPFDMYLSTVIFYYCTITPVAGALFTGFVCTFLIEDGSRLFSSLFRARKVFWGFSCS